MWELQKWLRKECVLLTIVPDLDNASVGNIQYVLNICILHVTRLGDVFFDYVKEGEHIEYK